ncbi:FMN-dependent dehydrogenase [Biscogniauxia sp. FL1348]|nr:FMN-dependent dehydrogenase [Biscogniauxia sp. FL1348]
MGKDDDGDVPPPLYTTYQADLYNRGILERTPPPMTTDPNKLRAQAKRVMRPEAFDYVSGGAGEGATMDANRLAFRQWKIIPRMMRPAAPRDLKVELFGEQYDTPVLCAPAGVQEVYHADKEVGTARACAELSVPFVMSTASTSTIQEVASASGDSGARWFQLYWPADDEITASLLQTAWDAGFRVLVVTLDTARLAWRPSDLDRTFLPFALGQGNIVGYRDPVFRRKFAAWSDGDTPEESPMLAARYWLSEIFSGNNRSWEELPLLKRLWPGPVVVKGIQHPEDARLAARYGADGIIVSNHGGRQVDGAVGSLEMLPDVVAAVEGQNVPVLFDSGVRTGADIFKALSLGARAVLVGRPVLYGLGIAGRDGVRHVLASLLAELDGTMLLAGVRSVRDLGPENLRRVAYGGDVKANL